MCWGMKNDAEIRSRRIARILNNPVRAQLVQDAKEWMFAGAIVPGYPNLNPGADDFWETFWKLYASQCDANAKRALPPR